MSTTPASPMTVENLLAVIKRLSPSELREFKNRFADWQNKEAKKSEAELIKATRLSLSPADKRRLQRLTDKSERGKLTEKELTEYQRLARQAEEIAAKRVAALAELVQRHKQPVSAVKRKIGWKNSYDS
ncbi:MAG: hypothetical protein AB1757_18165 [Acidobacteriota bacterium]